MKKKSIMLLIDGMQDIAYEALGGKTPREAGAGAAFARLEDESARVRFRSVPPDKEVDTVVCTLTLLGLPASRIPASRTCLEAMAERFDIGPGDLAARCSFVKIDGEGRIADPCCTPPDGVAQALMEAVQARHGSALRRIGGYRCIERFPGARAMLEGLRSFPAHNCAGLALRDVLPSGNALAERLAKSTLELLALHQPYTVLHWAPGVQEELPAFAALHGGLTGGMITKTLCLEGCARALEMRCPAVPGATGETDTDLTAKLEAALSLLNECDFILLHIGGADEATHRRNPVEKAEFIARIDRELMLPLLGRCPDGCRLLLACDHAALCATAGHTDEPVVGLLWEKGRVLSGDLGLLEGNEAVNVTVG